MGLLWLLTVAAASTITWIVISTAGARVSQQVSIPTVSVSTPTAEPLLATKSWSGTGGRLTATCSGGSISLDSAAPSVGYWVKVYDPGPQHLRVDFESTDPDDRGEVKLAVTCVDASPSFSRA